MRKEQIYRRADHQTFAKKWSTECRLPGIHSDELALWNERIPRNSQALDNGGDKQPDFFSNSPSFA